MAGKGHIIISLIISYSFFSLADCILQLTGNINDIDRQRGQYLDMLKVERERGITVKAQTASMIYEDKRTNLRYLFNLIDTPGHIDFSYEVSRSLASCQGALLLVDSTQNIQAQTLANYEKAKKLGLSIIPVVTKIDLPNSQPEETALTMGTTFGLLPEDVVMTSAKKAIGIEELMNAIVDRLPPPDLDLYAGTSASSSTRHPFLGRVVDSWFDEHRGVVCLVQVVSGMIEEGQRMSMFASLEDAQDIDKRSDFSIQEVGILLPKQLRTKSLSCGQVGYVIAGLRSTRQARVGDTMYIPLDWKSQHDIRPLPGYEATKPMLYASIFPIDSTQLESLFAAVDRLCLNDSSITVSRDQSSALGSGLRCGFLGFLHMEVFNQRLHDEFDMEIVMTTPSVPYIIQYGDGSKKEISNLTEWPDISRSLHFEILEPMVSVLIITPEANYGDMIHIIKEHRGLDITVTHLDDGQIRIVCLMPWQEVVCDMNDQVKNASSGYASFNYEEAGYHLSDLLKVEILVNGEPCDPLCFISHRSKALTAGRKMVIKLKEVLTRQQFEIVLQAKAGGKVSVN